MIVLNWRAWAAEEARPSPAPTPKETAVLPEGAVSVTEGKVQIDGRTLAYTATAAALTVRNKDEKPFGRIFYIAYELKGTKAANRPLTFVFNGGPGAASAYLHLGAMGPKRVVLANDGVPPPPPARLAENPATWLAFSDLVFVDPVGTGYSRALPVEEKEGKKQEAEKPPWGVHQDAESLASFIRLYLTREQRWLSPRFLVGESYGGFRVALLTQLLQADFGITLNGALLVSPALDFSLLRTDTLSLLPWAGLLPSYAAVAAVHKKGTERHLPETDLGGALTDVESFALSDLITALARGDTLKPNEEELLLKRLQEFTGLSLRTLRQQRGRVSAPLFARELLRDEQRVLSLYDGSVTVIDTNPGAQDLRQGDLYLDHLSAAVMAAFNSYVRRTLRFDTDLPYLLLNEQVSRDWNWRSGLPGQQGFVGVTDQLKTGMSLNTSMKVLIVHGAYDLVTPYFGSVIAVGLMDLDPSIRGNLQIKVYQGGHMPYTRSKIRERLSRDAGAFYQDALGGTR